MDLEELKDYLSIKYEIQVHDITPIKNVVKIYTDTGIKCLKRVKFDKKTFLFILSAMTHLIQKGFNEVLSPELTKDGEMYIKLDNGFGFLTEWVLSRECNYLNPVDLKLAASTLGRLHRCSSDFNPIENIDDRIIWGKWIERFTYRTLQIKKFKSIIEAKNNRTYFDRVYIENCDYFIDEALKSIEHLKEADYLKISLERSKSKCFCHHDYANHNVLISEDLKVNIIDFDYLICDMPIHDVCSLIIRNMRHGNYDMDKAQYIVDCYLKTGDIYKDELYLMNSFMEFPQDFWQVGLQYYIERLSWDEERFNKRLTKAVNDKKDRSEFLNEFKHSIII